MTLWQRERKIAVLNKKKSRLQTKVNKLNTESDWLNDFSSRARSTIAEKRLHDGKTKPDMTLKDVADLLVRHIHLVLMCSNSTIKQQQTLIPRKNVCSMKLKVTVFNVM